MSEAADSTFRLKTLEGFQAVDLTHTIEEGMPVYPTHPQYFHMEWNTGDPANMYQLLVSEHAGTHLDCPKHFYGDASDPRSIPLDDVPIQKFLGRAVKMDFTGREAGEDVSEKDLQAWEAAHRPIDGGDAVVLQFGWEDKWAVGPGPSEYIKSWPGISSGAARYLVERKTRLVGTDCLGIDASTTSDLGAHFTLLASSVLIVENLMNLAQLPDEFFMVTLPLKIGGGTGSPIRAVALVP